MRIEYTATAAGPTGAKGIRQPGQILNVPKKEAEALIEAGYAKLPSETATEEEDDLETAMVGPAEDAAARVGRPKGR